MSEVPTLDERQIDVLRAIAADLRTPLTTVLAGALTLDEGDRELSLEETKDVIRAMARSAKKLSRTIEDVADLERLARGHLALFRQPVEMASVVRLAALSESPPRETTIDVDARPVIISADPRRVTQIVILLVGEVARYASPASTIWVRAFPDGDGARIVVEAETTHMPSPLSVSSTGLPLAGGLADLHGGRMWMETPADGLKVCVFLPTIA